MADENTPSEGDAAKAAEEKEAAEAAAIAAKGKDPAAVEAALKSERASAREARKKAEAAEAKVKEYEDRDKSAQEKAEAKAADAEKRAQAAELKALRVEVALEKKLPSALAARLSGTTKEELETDADELLKLVKAENTTTFDGGARGSSTSKGTTMDDLIRSGF